MLPLDDRRVERFNPDLAGRPQLISGNSQILFGGMGRLTENSVLVLKNKSHSVTAEIDVPEGGANGVIVAQGGAFGGWSLYLHEGRPAYCYNLFGVQRFKVYGDDADPAGRASGADGVRLRRRRARQGRRRRRSTWTEPRSATGRVEVTEPMVFSADETTDVGCDSATPGQRRLRPEGRRGSPGAVDWVQIDIDEAAEDLDHLITPEERLRVAMARQ